MHEMSIAIDLLAQIERLAADHGAIRVERVELEIGILRQVAPEAMQAAFAVLTANTVAAGAVLEMTEVVARAECNRCETQYIVDIDEYLCPQCNQANARILAGNDIVIKSLTCQTDSNGAEHED